MENNLFSIIPDNGAQLYILLSIYGLFALNIIGSMKELKPNSENKIKDDVWYEYNIFPIKPNLIRFYNIVISITVFVLILLILRITLFHHENLPYLSNAIDIIILLFYPIVLIWYYSKVYRKNLVNTESTDDFYQKNGYEENSDISDK